MQTSCRSSGPEDFQEASGMTGPAHKEGQDAGVRACVTSNPPSGWRWNRLIPHKQGNPEGVSHVSVCWPSFLREPSEIDLGRASFHPAGAARGTGQLLSLPGLAVVHSST